jgi:hypothetical protein
MKKEIIEEIWEKMKTQALKNKEITYFKKEEMEMLKGKNCFVIKCKVKDLNPGITI